MILPNPYVILAGAGLFLAAVGGAYLTGRHHEADSMQARWDLDAAQKSATSQALVAAAEKRAREAENRAAEAAVKTEKEHADVTAKINAAYSDARRLGIRLRDTQARCAGGGNGLPSGTASPGDNLGGATAGAELSERANAGLYALAERADRTLAYANACKAWAVSVGR